MADFSMATIADCLERFAGGAAQKLTTDRYRSSGAYPIIDQGQAFIAGWTDDESGLISEGLPLVVFGDHTRAFKYVDFPFVRGADGTQVLKPKTGIDPLFFYYACQAISLPSRGYNRHFKELKESTFGLPDFDEQVPIGRCLRVVDQAIGAEVVKLDRFEALKRAAMSELFTCGLRGEVQKDSDIGPVPESWKLVQIATLGKVITGNTPPTSDRSNYDGGDVPFIAPGDIQHGRRTNSAEKFVSQSGMKSTRPLPKGSTCFVCIGSTIGKVGMTTAEVSCTNQQINSVVPSKEYDAGYVFHLLTYWSDHIKKQQSPSPVPIMSKGVFEAIEIWVTTDKSEQNEIAATLDAIDAKIDLHKRKKVVLEELFRALLHKLMTGEIRVADLDLSALEPAQRVAA